MSLKLRIGLIWLRVVQWNSEVVAAMNWMQNVRELSFVRGRTLELPSSGCTSGRRRRKEEEEEEDQTKLSYTDSSVLNPIDGMGLVKV
jgi:hypothetical protein